MVERALDAAKARGELAKAGQRNDLVGSGDEVKPTAADLGLRRDDIHDAIAIQVRAEIRLAEEVDAERAAGNLAASGERNDLLCDEKKVPTLADAGVSHNDMHEARQLRAAEAADPGIVERALDAIVARGDPGRHPSHLEGCHPATGNIADGTDSNVSTER